MRKLIAGDGFNHLVQGAHGYLLFNVNDKYIGRSIEKHGEWSPHEVELFRLSSIRCGWAGSRSALRTVAER